MALAKIADYHDEQDNLQWQTIDIEPQQSDRWEF
jgi:hypothetical protein